MRLHHPRTMILIQTYTRGRTKMNLLELTKAYRLLLNDEGELCEDWEAKIDSVGDAINAKLDAICRIIRSRELYCEAIDSEIERLKALKGRYEREADSLGKWACVCIGSEKIDTGTHRIYAKQSEAVEVVDESAIPEVYLKRRVIEEVKPDKNAIKADLKCGATIAGVQLKKNFSLQIK
jgi:hypothetical protein